MATRYAPGAKLQQTIGFESEAPLDSRATVNRKSDLNTIEKKYQGLLTFCLEDEQFYVYVDDTKGWVKYEPIPTAEVYTYQRSLTAAEFAALDPTAEGSGIRPGFVYNLSERTVVNGKEYPAGTDIAWGNAGWNILSGDNVYDVLVSQRTLDSRNGTIIEGDDSIDESVVDGGVARIDLTGFEMTGAKATVINSSTGESDVMYPSVKAVKDYVDTNITELDIDKYQLVSNKTDDIKSNKTSTTKYTTAKGVYDFVDGQGYQTKANISSSFTEDAGSDTKYPSVKAVEDYVKTSSGDYLPLKGGTMTGTIYSNNMYPAGTTSPTFDDDGKLLESNIKYQLGSSDSAYASVYAKDVTSKTLHLKGEGLQSIGSAAIKFYSYVADPSDATANRSKAATAQIDDWHGQMNIVSNKGYFMFKETQPNRPFIELLTGSDTDRRINFPRCAADATNSYMITDSHNYILSTYTYADGATPDDAEPTECRFKISGRADVLMSSSKGDLTLWAGYAGDDNLSQATRTLTAHSNRTRIDAYEEAALYVINNMDDSVAKPMGFKVQKDMSEGMGHRNAFIDAHSLTISAWNGENVDEGGQYTYNNDPSKPGMVTINSKTVINNTLVPSASTVQGRLYNGNLGLTSNAWGVLCAHEAHTGYVFVKGANFSDHEWAPIYFMVDTNQSDNKRLGNKAGTYTSCIIGTDRTMEFQSVASQFSFRDKARFDYYDTEMEAAEEGAFTLDPYYNNALLPDGSESAARDVPRLGADGQYDQSGRTYPYNRSWNNWSSDTKGDWLRLFNKVDVIARLGAVRMQKIWSVGNGESQVKSGDNDTTKLELRGNSLDMYGRVVLRTRYEQGRGGAPYTYSEYDNNSVILATTDVNLPNNSTAGTHRLLYISCQTADAAGVNVTYSFDESTRSDNLRYGECALYMSNGVNGWSRVGGASGDAVEELTQTQVNYLKALFQ